jgi:predicted nucleotidyltransferase
MQTIIKQTIWRILELFYINGNKPSHLRDIARQLELNQSGVLRHLNQLTKKEVLLSTPEANLKKFSIRKDQIPNIFPLFDQSKFNSLNLLRRNAITNFINLAKEKPVVVVVFGSTAKGKPRRDSDLDLLEITNRSVKREDTLREVESQTGIHIQLTQICLKDFKTELKLGKDKLIQSAVNSGFPAFNANYYYKLKNE